MIGLPAFIVAFSVQASIPVTLPDTPTNHWFYKGLAQAKRGGLLVDHDDGFFRMRIVPRKELAEDLLDAMTTYRNVGRRLLNERSQLVAFPGSVTKDRVQAYGAEVADYASLNTLLVWSARGAVEFRREFATLGNVPSPAELMKTTKRISELGPNVPGQKPWLFSDVPTDHWAAKAVGDLCALGLLDGYPDGRFRG